MSSNRTFESAQIVLVRVLMFVLTVAGLWISNSNVTRGQTAQVESLATREGNDWPRFLGTGINGVSSETGILKDWSNGKLKIRWEMETGEGYCMGVASAGRFFHFGKYDDKAILHCVNAETGKSLWKFEYDSNYQDLYGYDSGPRSSPLVDGDRVYIFGVEGMLHCLNVETGKVIWKVGTSEKFGVIQNFFGVGSTPVIHKDKLIVMIGGSPDESQEVAPGRLHRVKPNGSGIVAFDKMTGRIKYKSVNDLASYSSLKMMKRDGREVLLAWMRGALYGVDPDTGIEMFKFPWRARKLESVNAATPVVIGEMALISESYELGSVLLDLSSNKPASVWDDKGVRKQALASHWNTPVQHENYIYGCSGQHSGAAELRCVEWKTGEVKWKQKGYGRASMVKIDDHLILFGERGELELIKLSSDGFEGVTKYSSEDGKPLGLRGPCWPAPIVSRGLLYVRGTKRLVCLELIPQ